MNLSAVNRETVRLLNYLSVRYRVSRALQDDEGAKSYYDAYGLVLHGWNLDAKRVAASQTAEKAKKKRGVK
jgi:hypothetical protein